MFPIIFIVSLDSVCLKNILIHDYTSIECRPPMNSIHRYAFYSRDLDLYPMTLIYEIMMYLCTKNNL